jgi:hypothetical protein
MECSTCEERGLVYCVREPDECESVEAQRHFSENEECREECEKSWRVQEQARAPGLLDAAPSAKIDTEILRVCSDGRKRVTATVLFPAFIRKAIIPATLFIMGFMCVGYIALNMENAHQIKSAGMAVKTSVPAAQPQAPAIQVTTAKDSLKDILHNPKSGFANNRGNLDGNGVITVDLEKK